MRRSVTIGLLAAVAGLVLSTTTTLAYGGGYQGGYGYGNKHHRYVKHDRFFVKKPFFHDKRFFDRRYDYGYNRDYGSRFYSPLHYGGLRW